MVLYFRNLAAAQTTGADLEGGAGIADHRAHLVQVRLPHPAGLVVSVADIVSRNGLFSADITLACHRMFPSILRYADLSKQTESIDFPDQIECPMYQKLLLV